MSLAEAGRAMGILAGITGTLVVLLSGFITQRLSKWRTQWLLGVPSLANLFCVPFVLMFLLLPQQHFALMAFAGVSLLSPAMLGPSMAATQSLAKLRMRAVAAALVTLGVNLIGIGLGSLLVGVASDLLRPALGTSSLRYALLLTALTSLGSGLHFALASRHLPADLEAVRPGIED
jgi:hypothetical protein